MLCWIQDGKGVGTGDGTALGGVGRVSAPPDFEGGFGLALVLDNEVMACPPDFEESVLKSPVERGESGLEVGLDIFLCTLFARGHSCDRYCRL